MTTRGFASLCLKLIAMYYLVQMLASLATASFLQIFDRNSQMGLVYVILIVGLPAAGSLGLLWLLRSSDSLAQQLVADDAPLVSVQVAVRDLQVVAFSCLGLACVISAVGELTPIIAYHYVVSHYRHAGAVLGDMETVYSNMAGILLRLGVGVVLFVHPGGFAALWAWIQKHRGLKDA